MIRSVRKTQTPRVSPWRWLALLLLECAISADVSDSRRLNQGFRQHFVAGQFKSLAVQALQGIDDVLYKGGYVRIRPQGWPCGTEGTFQMDETVQPPCIGNICKAPARRYGDLAIWEGLRLAHVGVYQICYCRPNVTCGGPSLGMAGEGCCLDDQAFNESAGEVEVAGPRWVSISPVLGQDFRFELAGLEVSPNSQALFRIAENTEDDPGCAMREPRKEDERRATRIRYAIEQDSEVPFGLSAASREEYNISQGTYGSRVFVAALQRRLQFRLCWCAMNCFDSDGEIDELAFAAEVGEFLPRGPDTETSDALALVAGVRFSVRIEGNLLSRNDRIRIVDHAVGCGDENTDHSLAFRPYICGRTGTQCVLSPATNSPPTAVREITHPGMTFFLQEETWDPVEIDTPGLYRLCWCVDDTWDPVLLESRGLCGEGQQFSVDAGTLQVQGAFGHQEFRCTAFRPCSLEVFSELEFEAGDQLMVISPDPTSTNSLVSHCGRGNTGIQVALVTARGVYYTGTTTTEPYSAARSTTTPGIPQPIHYAGDFELSSAGQRGLYRVCYCKLSHMGPCDDASAFAQYAGFLNISAQLQETAADKETKKCLALTACRFNITGVWAMQINFFDRFRAIPMHETCGQPVEVVGFAVFEMDQRHNDASVGHWVAQFSHDRRELYDTGDYRLCYCQASLTQSERCTEETQYSQDVGRLQVLGARMSSFWTCRQGSFCELMVPGWRLSTGDAVRLIDHNQKCGSADQTDAYLAKGFDHNPSYGNKTENVSGGVLITFDLGRARGSGLWKVCLCAAQASKSTALSAADGCSQAYDFAQEVGELEISGLLNSVVGSPQVPSVAVVTLLVDVVRPSKGRSVGCALSNQSLDEAPSSWAILTCEANIPGCLGMATLPWVAQQGYNALHVPLNAELAARSAGPNGRTRAHAWCTGDIEECSSGRCAMPPTGLGFQLELYPGIETGAEWTAVLGHPYELEVHGNGLNAMDGQLEPHWEAEGCPEVDFLKRAKAPAFTLPRPWTISPMKYVKWEIDEAPMAGRFRLCWCDRSYGNDCVLWQVPGRLVIAGPINVSAPEVVQPSEDFNVTMAGENLTSEDLIFIVSGATCSTAGSDTRAKSVASWVVYGDRSWANFTLKAPQKPGDFSLCWIRGQDSSMSPLHLTQILSRESRDCLLSGWEAVMLPASNDSNVTAGATACSRPCGGGLYELRRRVVAEAMGGGLECPSSDSPSRSRWEPCNLHPCPGAHVDNVRTRPAGSLNAGQSFQVEVLGERLDPAEDRIILLTNGEAVSCGDFSDDEAANTSENMDGINSSNSSGAPRRLNTSDAGLVFSTTTSAASTSPLHAGGASCQRPESNVTSLLCGDGAMTLRVMLPGIYRVCLCDASAHTVQFVNHSGAVTESRDRCSRLSDFRVAPGNGSLLEIVAAPAAAEAPIGTINSIVQSLGIQDLAIGVQEKKIDSWLVVGLISASLLYCVAMYAACKFWQYRRRVNNKYRKKRKAQGTGIISNSLVARATRAAWEAYANTINEHQLSSGESEAEQEEEQVIVGADVSGSSFRSERPNSGAKVTGSLTPPGTGLSRGSMNSASTTSTRATTPGSRPSLLKVALNKDSRPVTPKMGGSFLDLPLAGKGTGKPSLTRPGTGASLEAYAAVEHQSKEASSSSSSSRPDTPSADRDAPEPPVSASIIERPAEPGQPPPMLQLVGLEKKLAKLKKEQDTELKEEQSPTPSPKAPVKSMIPAPPSMAPPSLPGQLENPSSPTVQKPPSKKPQQSPRQEVPQPEVTEVPVAPAKQPPSLEMLLLPPPPPPRRAPKVFEDKQEGKQEEKTNAIPEDLETAVEEKDTKVEEKEKDAKVEEKEKPQKEKAEESVTLPRKEEKKTPRKKKSNPLDETFFKLVEEKVNSTPRVTPRQPAEEKPAEEKKTPRKKQTTSLDETFFKLVAEKVNNTPRVTPRQPAEKAEVEEKPAEMQEERPPEVVEEKPREDKSPAVDEKLEKPPPEAPADQPVEEETPQEVVKEKSPVVEEVKQSPEMEDAKETNVEKMSAEVAEETKLAERPVEGMEKHDSENPEVKLDVKLPESLAEGQKKTSAEEVSAPKLSNWVGDMRSRMASNRPKRESKIAPSKIGSKLAPSTGLRKPLVPRPQKLGNPVDAPELAADDAEEKPAPAPLPPEPTLQVVEEAPPEPAPGEEAPPEPAAELPPAEPAPMPPVEEEPVLKVPDPKPIRRANRIQTEPEKALPAIQEALPAESAPRDFSEAAATPAAAAPEDDLEIVRCYTPAGPRPPGPPPQADSDLPSAWRGTPSPTAKKRKEFNEEAPIPQTPEEADRESEDLGTAREWKQLPTGTWEDSQEKLRQEWHQKLNGREAADEKPAKRASLRAAAGGRRPGASLRGSASVSASAANSMAPSRSSLSPANSPRSLDVEEVEQSSPSSGGPAPIFGPPPGWKTASPSSGPAPIFGPPPGWQTASPSRGGPSLSGPGFGPGPGPGLGPGPGPGFGPGPGPGPGFGPRPPQGGPGRGPALGGPPNQRLSPNTPNWAFCAP